MAIFYRMKTLYLLLILACTAPGQALFNVVYNVDASQSRVAFTLGDVLHTVHGTFKVKRGSIRFDSSAGTASGEIVVDSASGDSGSKARDKRMHRDILESQKFPEITFAPSRVRGTVNPSGESKVEVDGTFTIHGTSHALTAPAVVNASGHRLQTKVHFAVPYVSWGMKNPSTLFLRVGESVDIDMDLDLEAAGH